VWLNPDGPRRWEYTPSVGITRELVAGRMFPLTIAGLDSAIRELKRPLSVTPSAHGDMRATAVTQHSPP
jgi:hypothetical protein